MRKTAITHSDLRAAADQLHSAAIHLLRALRLQDEASGVGPARLSVLSILVFIGPKSMLELAQMEQVKPPTMSKIIDGLEKDGFANRKSDKTDRRRILVFPTPKGIKLLKEARERRILELAMRMERLSDEDHQCIARASKLIEKILKRPAT